MICRVLSLSALMAVVTFLASATIASAAEPSTQPATQPARFVVDSTGQHPAPFIGLDNVCAWPLLTIRDGVIYGVIFNKPSHGRMIGGIDCISSTDSGKTWKTLSTAAPPEPGTQTNRMNEAYGQLPNGKLVVVSSGWTLYPKPSALGPMEVDKVLDPWVCVSSDNGKTWSIDKTAFPPKAPSGLTQITCFPIEVGQDGAMRVITYEIDLKTKWRTVYIWRSADEGKTWGDPVALDPKTKCNETCLLHLGGGHWIAAVREAQLMLYRSDDDAKTWKFVHNITETNAVPGTLLKLADGRILLSNGNRTKGDERCEVRISNDGGMTFSDPVRLVNFITFDGGYPSSVQLPDGRIVTAYYARKTDYHDGYHMGVMIWDPIATFGPAAVASAK